MSQTKYGILVSVRRFILKPRPCDRAPCFVLAGLSPSPVRNYPVVCHIHSHPCLFCLYAKFLACTRPNHKKYGLKGCDLRHEEINNKHNGHNMKL